MHFSFSVVENPASAEEVPSRMRERSAAGRSGRPGSVVLEPAWTKQPEVLAWESEYCDVADNAAKK
jgi:hypothetical protein